MQTATYIDQSTREAIRARAISYIATDVAPGMTLDEHRRGLARRSASGPRRGASSARLAAAVRRRTGRYPDDPVGDYETTEGGW
jgi:hypothetical protein